MREKPEALHLAELLDEPHPLHSQMPMVAAEVYGIAISFNTRGKGAVAAAIDAAIDAANLRAFRRYA